MCLPALGHDLGRFKVGKGGGLPPLFVLDLIAVPEPNGTLEVGGLPRLL